MFGFGVSSDHYLPVGPARRLLPSALAAGMSHAATSRCIPVVFPTKMALCAIVWLYCGPKQEHFRLPRCVCKMHRIAFTRYLHKYVQRYQMYLGGYIGLSFSFNYSFSCIFEQRAQ